MGFAYNSSGYNRHNLVCVGIMKLGAKHPLLFFAVKTYFLMNRLIFMKGESYVYTRLGLVYSTQRVVNKGMLIACPLFFRKINIPLNDAIFRRYFHMNMTKRMLIKNLIDDVFMLLALDFIVFRFKIAYIIAKLKMKYIYKNDANIHKAKAYLKWVEREVEREKDDFMLVRRIRYAWKRIFRLGQ